MPTWQQDSLQQAKRNKKDEFYTQLIDIEEELQYYTTAFRGKTVYLNCDDPGNLTSIDISWSILIRWDYTRLSLHHTGRTAGRVRAENVDLRL